MRILRFGISSRVLHWSHAIIFIWLLVTGAWMFLTPISLLGNPLIKVAHIYASLPFVLLPAIICIFDISARNDVKELMFFTSGKYNWGQKANFMTAVLLFTGFSFSGFVVWMKLFGKDFVELNFMAHDLFAVIALLLLSGHIIFTLYYSESLRGMVYGAVDTEWAKERYPNWFKRNQN